MQPTGHDADDGFQRWYLGGAPGADDQDPQPAALQQERERPITPPPAPRPQRESWFAAGGSLAALALLWSFYGVVDGAVERSELRAAGPGSPAVAVQADEDRSRQQQAARMQQAEIDRVHAVYSLPAAGGSTQPVSLHYTRWP